MSIINESLTSILQINKKNLKIVVIFILICGVCYPFIDSLFIKPVQIEQEISILTKINDLSNRKLSKDIELKLYADINAKAEKLITNNQISENLIYRYNNDPWKLYSGILLWIIVLIALLFQKQKLMMKIAPIFLLILIIAGIGAIGLMLPTIISPWVNYFGYPLLQIVFLVSSMDIKPEKKK